MIGIGKLYWLPSLSMMRVMLPFGIFSDASFKVVWAIIAAWPLASSRIFQTSTLLPSLYFASKFRFVNLFQSETTYPKSPGAIFRGPLDPSWSHKLLSLWFPRQASHRSVILSLSSNSSSCRKISLLLQTHLVLNELQFECCFTLYQCQLCSRLPCSVQLWL